MGSGSSAKMTERLARLAAALHVDGDHQYLGRYSIEKLHLFERYSRTATPLRVALVIGLTPLPTLLALLAMDLVPLNAPSAGPSQNAVAFVRSTVSHAAMTFFTLLPLKQALSLAHDELSFKTIACIACVTALTIEAVCIPLAFAWRFPVPFREMIGLPIWTCAVATLTFGFAQATMRRLWRRRKLQTYVPIVGVQLTLFYLFLSLSVGFAYLSLLPQTAMILTFPLVKVVLKGLVWKYAQRLDDISTDVTICMLEVSGSLYQTVCIESVSTPWLGVLIFAADVLQAIHEVRAYVKVDYLGDGRNTLATALKIVESSIFSAGDEDHPTKPSASMLASPSVASLADALESSYADTTTRSMGESLSAPFSRRRTGRSSVESLSSTARDDFGASSDDLLRTIPHTKENKLQGKSVVMQPKHVRERTASGKRKRRLIDLELFEADTPGLAGIASQGRTASQGRVESTGASQGRMASQGRVESTGRVASQGRVPSTGRAETLNQASGAATAENGVVGTTKTTPVHTLTRVKSASDPKKAAPVHVLTRVKSASLVGSSAASRPSFLQWLLGKRSSSTRTTVVAHYTDLNALPAASDAPTNAPKSTPADRSIAYVASRTVTPTAELRDEIAPAPVSAAAAHVEEKAPARVQEQPRYARSPGSGVPVRPVGQIRRRSKRRRTSSIVIDGITIKRREQARILEQTLQLLFSSEVLLFAEYMEVAIPVLYALTIGAEWALPNGQYNLIVRTMSASTMSSQIWTSLVYALLELTSLLGMYYVLRTKYGVSAFYQLAFVLEKYWMTLQGKLVGSFIVVMNAVTVHQGTDFTFRFDTAVAPSPTMNNTRQ